MLWTPVRIPPPTLKPRGRRTAASCIFCGASPPLTAEHVWSKWLAAEVPDLGHFGTEVTGVVGIPTTWRRRRRKASSVRPKIVCATCNNGWMSALQEGAKPYIAPLIRGESCSLASDQQELVASWLTMTAMTAPWANPDHGSWAIPQSHRTELCTNRKPPQSTQVLIAPCAHDRRPIGTAPFGMRYRLIRLDHMDVTTPAGVILPSRPGYGVALSVGNLAAVIFGHAYDPIRQPMLAYDGLLDRALKPIWPSSDTSVEWPRDYALNYEDFNRLIAALEPWQ
jgi:hypothetical protein